MNVALYFITHEGIVSQLLKVACSIVRKPVENIAYMEIPLDADVESYTRQSVKAVAQLDTASGLIIITDIYGATPSNIAQTLTDEFQATLISGLNLPMLLRLLNYRNEKLPQLITKAITGGKSGIQQH